MKKILFAIACLPILFSCVKEENPVQKTEPFRIQVNLDDEQTKTNFDPETRKVTWESTDELSILINDGTTITSYKFVKESDEVEVNAFVCNEFSPEANVNYTYNLMYPYSNYAEEIDSEGYCGGYIEFPSKGNASLTQKALNDATHIKGALYGQATAVGSEKPTVKMSHLTHLFKINVINKTDAEVVISNVAVSNDADKALAGDFYPNFSTGDLKLRSGSGLTTTDVKISATLAIDASGFVYIPTPAVTIPEGSKLTFTVTCESGESFEIVKDINSELVCAAGHIRPVTLELTTLIPADYATVEDGKYWIIANGKVATSAASDKSYAYLPVEKAVESKSTDVNAFTFTHQGDGKYTIQDCYGRYLYMPGSYNNFNLSTDELSDDNAMWRLYLSDGVCTVKNVSTNKYIQYDASYDNYGAYSDLKGTLPQLVAATDPVTPSPLSTPSNITASNITATSITLTWDGNEYTGGYIISYDNAGENKSVSVASNSATITDLTAETEYTFSIVAKATESAWMDSKAGTVTTTTSQAAAGGDFEPVQEIIELSFSENPAATPVIPSGTKQGLSYNETETSYAIDGYTWAMYKAYYHSSSKCLWFNKGYNAYLLTPSLDGKKLVQITLNTEGESAGAVWELRTETSEKVDVQIQTSGL